VAGASNFKRYYEDELAFLRELGGEFAHAYPDIARELGLAGHDPDVERLLQGVAFLTGRIRQGLEAQFPDLLYPVLGHIWPQALRPSPCAVMLEFQPRPNMFREPFVLHAGSHVRSEPVEGTACQFSTAYDTTILPIKLDDVALSTPTTSLQRLTIGFRPLPGTILSRLGAQPLRLHFHGATVKGMGREAFGLYACLAHYLRSIRLRVFGPGGAVLAEPSLSLDTLKPVGWTPAESLLPYPRYSFTSYRHLTEYFLFPPKYLFYDLDCLSSLSNFPTAERFELIFDTSPLPGEPLNESLLKECVRLNCVPAVNLFSHTASPITIDGTRTEYPLRPEGSAPHHIDVFSVEKVTGHVARQPRPVEYFPFFSFHRPKTAIGEQPILYHVIPRAPVAESRVGHDNLPTYAAVPVYLSFVTAGGGAADLEAVVSVDLLCTNRDLPLRLRTGDISKPTSDIPSTLQFRDIGPIAAPAPAPVGGDGLWRLFSHQLVGLHHFKDRDALRILLQLFDFRARVNQSARQKLEALIDALADVKASPDTCLVGRPPAVTRGTRIDLQVHEDRFAYLGELVLLGSALDHFLAESAEINTFTRLAIRGIDHDFTMSWPARLGTQGLL
jgi:type VI secretion system protein ImpG